MSLLIAEIGNCHLGDIRLAKELIRVAHESGADLIKGQAFRAEDIKTGSMKPDFYRRCEFTEAQYIELMEYARSLKTDMFFSVFSKGFEGLERLQKWCKLSAGQTKSGMFRKELDTETSVVSVPRSMIEERKVPRMRNGWMLYATEYMIKDPGLDLIDQLRMQTSGPVGLSDHTLGVSACLKAVRWYGVSCIEKHFTLKKAVSWGGTVFRDTVHGATPKELEQISKAMHA